MAVKKKIYFLSDVHLGSAFHLAKAEQQNIHFPNSTNRLSFAKLEVERKLCRWLDMIKPDAEAIYLLGDIFDYWFEYKNVVPRGFTRFLGKIGELTDAGIAVHFFIGNHDIWLTDYLQEECGMIIHKKILVTKIGNKNFL